MPVTIQEIQIDREGEKKMGFFDDMNKQLTRVGQSAVKKANDVSESVRISSAIREEEDKQEKWFKQLGQYFYENYPDSNEEEPKTLYASIASSKDLVQEYKKQLNILKGAIECPNCGASIANNATFCSNCGTKIEHIPVQMPSDSGIRCHSCGAPMEKGQRFCINCGAEMVEASSEETETKTVSVCPSCGAPVESGAGFCVVCGTPINKE